jgi:hypothetical protein
MNLLGKSMIYKGEKVVIMTNIIDKKGYVIIGMVGEKSKKVKFNKLS